MILNKISFLRDRILGGTVVLNVALMDNMTKGIYTENKMGPRIEPWGTPQISGAVKKRHNQQLLTGSV